jgi:hypothetical protein
MSTPADLPERKITANQVVAYNMAHYRWAAGLTQEELGSRLGGWTKVAVSAAERSWDGKRIRKFDADDLAALAMALGVPVAAFFLPPDDSDMTFRYVLDGPGFPDFTTLLPQILSASDDDSPSFRAYRNRVFRLGLSSVENVGRTHAIQLSKDDAKEYANRIQEAMQEAAHAHSVDGRQHLVPAKELVQIMVGSLVQERAELERRVDDLRAFEREYRARLVLYLETQLDEVKTGVDVERVGALRRIQAIEKG